MPSTTRLSFCGMLACALTLSGGCKPEGESPAAKGDEKTKLSGELLILCGSSFRPPMEKLVEMYEKATGKKHVLSFGGSEDHLPNVKAKAAGDLYVSHTPYQAYTKDAGALLRDVEVGFLAPVLVVTKGNPQKLEKVEDLAKPELRVVLPNPEYSTCGQMVAKLLEKKGIQEAVSKNVGNALMKHHSEIGNQLKLGTRDAGIMWNGVSHNFLDAIEVVQTPYEYDEEIRVSVMGLSYTQQTAEVTKFLDFVEENGKKVFAEFGYVK